MLLTTAPNALGWGISISPNGKLLAVGTDQGIVRFWNLPITSAAPAGTSISVGSANKIEDITFSPGSDFVALAFGPQAEIWNVATRDVRLAAHAHGVPRRHHNQLCVFDDVFGQRRCPGRGRRHVRQGAGLRRLTGD